MTVLSSPGAMIVICTVILIAYTAHVLNKAFASSEWFEENAKLREEGSKYRDLYAHAIADAEVWHLQWSAEHQENAKLRVLLEAVLQCAGEIKRDKGCDACPMYNGPWRKDGVWCLLRSTLRELGVEVDE